MFGLPVNTLGCLITSRLHANDCQILLDKILFRIQSWTNKSLSYGGRAQLIKSVLFSTQIYWSTIFILPQKILSNIEKLLRSFFWTGIHMKSVGAKVAWADVCAPKEGGLDFRVLKDWNGAAMTKYLWALALKADTLWVKWIHTYIIKHQCLWTIPIPIPASVSWTVRKLFKLRPLVQPWITYVVGNGRNTFIWLDNWHTLGPLFAKFGSRVVYNLGRNLNAKVATIIVNNTWQWPRCRNSVTREILGSTPTSLVPHPNQEDSVIWN